MLCTLAIEISNPSPAVVGKCGSGVALGDVQPGGAAVTRARSACGKADDLMTAVDAVLKEAGKSARDLERVAVSVGPGGYTSLRMAVTAAKCICRVGGAESVAIPTANAVLRRVPIEIRDGDRVIIALAWKRNETWRAIVERGEKEPGNGGIITLEELAQEATGAHLVADHWLVPQLRKRGLAGDGLYCSEPVFDAESVLEASAGSKPIDPFELMPMYPRKPEAVRLWEQGKGRRH